MVEETFTLRLALGSKVGIEIQKVIYHLTVFTFYSTVNIIGIDLYMPLYNEDMQYGVNKAPLR